jgi:S-formylglutathione hydrolase
LIEASLPVLPGVKSISGHSMGGHGALICALKEQDAYRSVSAFSPICHPVKSPWGETCFATYLGDDREQWKAWDATELVSAGHDAIPVLIDQGTNDEFLAEQLFPQDLQSAYDEQGGSLILRMQEGYDHSYHFIATFIGEHLAYHAKALRG